MNSSEFICNKICRGSFLSFWSFPNPKRKDNLKEFTDILIVCSPYVILISVKDIEIADSGDATVDSQRWYKRAIEKSYDQLYGAERIIANNITNVMTESMEYEIHLPPRNEMKLLRIGISLGRRQNFALPFGQFETGFVHFFDQFSFPILLDELDTITDFTGYLTVKEQYFDSGKSALFRSEEDLLAIYLHRGRKFPEQLDELIIEPFVWTQLQTKAEFQRRKEQEKKSYIWDAIIEEFFKNYSQGVLLFSNDLYETERALRAMAKEIRFNRMFLAETFLDFIGFYGKSKARARMIRSQSGTVYVFLLDDHREKNRDQRVHELGLRCLVGCLRSSVLDFGNS